MTTPVSPKNPKRRGFFRPRFSENSPLAWPAGGCSKRSVAVIGRSVFSRNAFVSAATISVASMSLFGCGGNKPPPKPQVQDVAAPAAERQPDVNVNAEIGGLNEEATGKIFERAEPGFDRCYKSRTKQVEFLAGTVRFFVVIGSDQKASSVTIEESSLGDREAEKCMQGVLFRQKWPKPVGGRTAHARYTAAAFEPPDPEVREPVSVGPDQIGKLRGKLKKQAGECRVGSASPYQITAYIDTNGKVITASATSADPAGELTIDCLVDLVRTAQFPSPGSYAGKVTFEL
jgi:hypothetical protein